MCKGFKHLHVPGLGVGSFGLLHNPSFRWVGAGWQVLLIAVCLVVFFLSPQAEPIRVLVTGAAGQIAYSLLFSIAKGDVFGKDQVRKTCKWTQSRVFSKLICLDTWTNLQQTREQTYQHSCHVTNRPLEGPVHQLVVWFVRGCIFSCLLCPSQSSWCCWTFRPCCPCWTVLWWSCRTALSRCSEVSHHHLLIMNQFTAQSWSESWIKDNDSKMMF